MKYFYIAIGGAIGSILRHMSSSWLSGWMIGSQFPWGTFIVNLSGSFIIGLIAGFNQVNPMSPNMRLFLFTGLLGGFTTYSSYALETFTLLRENQSGLAISYVLFTSVLGILFSGLGYLLSQQFLRN